MQPAVANIGSGVASYTQGYQQSSPIGLHDIFAAAQAANMTSVEIAYGPTITATELANLQSYIADNSTTGYGVVRAAKGQTAPWTSVFNEIILASDNESWNAVTPGLFYYPGYPYTNYGPLVVSQCTTLKAQSTWNSTKEKCAVNVQQFQGGLNATAIAAIDPSKKIDLLDSSDYYLVGTNTTCTPSTWFLDSWAGAWADTTDTSTNIYGTGTGSYPTVNYESNWGSISGACNTTNVAQTQAGEGAGLTIGATLPLLQQKYLNQFLRMNMWLFALDNVPYSSTAGTSPATTVPLWGLARGMGGAMTQERPAVYALALSNACLALGTGYPATRSTEVTFNHTASNGVPAYSNVPLVQSFANKSGSTRCVHIYNADASPHYYNFSGTNVPTGTVTQTVYGSANVSDTNETSPTVGNTVTSISAPTTLMVPAYGAVSLLYSTSVVTSTVHTFGGSVVIGGASQQ